VPDGCKRCRADGGVTCGAQNGLRSTSTRRSCGGYGAPPHVQGAPVGRLHLQREAAQASDGTPFNFFQPDPEKWYHIQTHIRMNTAGISETPRNTDGICAILTRARRGQDGYGGASSNNVSRHALLPSFAVPACRSRRRRTRRSAADFRGRVCPRTRPRRCSADARPAGRACSPARTSTGSPSRTSVAVADIIVTNPGLRTAGSWRTTPGRGR
jgi:hypothetical protein